MKQKHKQKQAFRTESMCSSKAKPEKYSMQNLLHNHDLQVPGAT